MVQRPDRQGMDTAGRARRGRCHGRGGGERSAVGAGRGRAAAARAPDRRIDHGADRGTGGDARGVCSAEAPADVRQGRRVVARRGHGLRPARGGPVAVLRARVDRHRCIGAGNCITIAPSAFDWHDGDFAKADVVDPASVEDELLREAALACPTQAIVIEEVQELLPWQLRTAEASRPRRVMKTFMFTDMVGSTALVEALGDEAWATLLRWHDDTLRSLFAAHQGAEITDTGDGFFVGFDSPEAALTCAVAIQRRLAEQRQAQGFAPQVRIGVHASEATQVAQNFRGKGVHEASRIAALAGGGEILASRVTAAGSRYEASQPRTVTLKGIAEAVEIVSIS